MMRATAILCTAMLAFACSSGGGDQLQDAGGMDAAAVSNDKCTDMTPCHLVPKMMDSDHIQPVGDVDPWTFDVPTAGQVIHLVVSNDADFSPIRLQVTLLDPMSVSVRTDTFMGNGKQKIDIQVIATSAGTFKALVSDVGNDGEDRRNPYFISVDLLTETDMNEPNDDRMHATVLTPGMEAHGTIGFQGDEDWFSLDTPAGKLIHIDLAAPAPVMPMMTVKLRYELYAPDGTTRVAESTEPGTGAVMLQENRAVKNQAGKYFIRIIDATNSHADLMRLYGISASFVDEPDAQDRAAPNDTAMTATQVTSGQTLTAFIAAKADVDWYAIDIPSASPSTPQLITVTAHMGMSPVDLQFEVFLPDGRTLICASDAECKALRFVVDGTRCNGDLATAHVARAPGKYLVAVRDHQDDDYDAAISYMITIANPAEPDANERYETNCDMNEDGCKSMARAIPAMTASTSQVIAFPWVDGAISYAGDEDWFRFDVPGNMPPIAGQNGDWRVQLELNKMGPSAVELEGFFIAGGPFSFEKGVGEMCMMPMDGACDPSGCQIPDAQNTISLVAGEGPVGNVDCLVVFREHTDAGPLFFRFTDLNHDDFDVSAATAHYQFRLTFTAECPATSLCKGMYDDGQGHDLCGQRL
jgi:hypothetical protein